MAGDDASAVAGVHARLFDVFHDRADDGVLAVGHAVDVHLGGVLEEAVEQDGSTGSHLGALLHVVPDLVLRVHDSHGAAAKNEGGAEKKGKTDLFGDGDRFVRIVGGAIGRLAEAQLVEEGGKEFAVLRPFDGFHGCAQNAQTGGLEFRGQVQGSLSAKLEDDAPDEIVFILGPINMDDVLGSEWFEVEFVRGVVVGGDGLRVGVDHDGLEAVLAEGEAGVDAAVVELDTLADAVGTATEDNDFGLLGGAGFVVVRVIGGVVVGRVSLELRGAGIDEAVGGQKLLFFPPSPDGPGTSGQLSVGSGEEAGEVQIGQPGQTGLAEEGKGGRVAQPRLLFDPAGDLGDFAKVVEEPGINGSDLVDFLHGPAPVEGVAEVPEPGGVGRP